VVFRRRPRPQSRGAALPPPPPPGRPTAPPAPPDWIERLVRESQRAPDLAEPFSRESSRAGRGPSIEGGHLKKHTREIGTTAAPSPTKGRTADGEYLLSGSTRQRSRKTRVGSTAAVGRDPPDTVRLEPPLGLFMDDDQPGPGRPATRPLGQTMVSHERVRVDEGTGDVDAESGAVTVRDGVQQLLDASARIDEIVGNVRFR
jgi:hypothetical protein